MKKPVLLVLLAVLFIAVIGGVYTATRGPTLPKPKTHVLLITLDTTRADRLGCYGYPKGTSPNLDKFAQEAVQFDWAMAQAAVTPPSHASILTGLNPYHHKLRVLHGLVENHLAPDQQTLAEVWQAAGGQTAAFVSAFPVTSAFGLDQGFAHFDAHFPQTDGKGLVSEDGIVNTGMSQRRADVTTRAAIEWLNDQADMSEPLLMWVHYFDPHDPFLLPPQGILNQFGPVSTQRDDRLRAIYDGEVFYMDSFVGQLFAAFKDKGLWSDTVVVVVADHGEGLGDHDWWSHGILYQEQIHVPLLIRVPGVDGGRRIQSLVRTIDVMPTVLEAAGVDPGMWPFMDGKSLMAAMRTGQGPDGRLAYADSVNLLTYGRPDTRHKVDEKADKLYCLTDGTHKLIYHQLQPDNLEFYNLQSDPQELHNLAAAKPQAMQQLMDRLKELNAFSDIMPGMTPSDLDRVNRLKDLGYVE